MAKVDLPSGGWVEFKEPSDLRRKDRKVIVRALVDTDAYEAADTAAIQLITSWSFGDVVTTELLDDLTIDDTNVIEKTLNELMERMAGNFETNPDPKAPSAS